VVGRRAVPLFSLCPGIRLTTEEKHGKTQSGQLSTGGLCPGLYSLAEY
jgi:hypothetical protein